MLNIITIQEFLTLQWNELKKNLSQNNSLMVRNLCSYRKPINKADYFHSHSLGLL